MKLIKFDLPINGTKVRSLEELRENLTTEILELHASGLLLKWLRVRELSAVADKVADITAESKCTRWAMLLNILELPPTELNLFEAIESIDLNTRVELAKKADLPHHLQEILLKDVDKPVLIALAGNQNLSAETQSELVSNESSDVLAELASNPRLIKEIQGALYDKLDRSTRRILARNPALTKELYEKVKSDAIEGLAENPSLSEEDQILLLDAEKYIRHHLARNPSLSKNVQLKLARDVSDIQKIIARNPVIGDEVQATLVSGVPEVQVCLAKNPSLEIEHQSKLLLSGNVDVVLALFANSALDENVKFQLLQSFQLSDFYAAESDWQQQSSTYNQLPRPDWTDDEASRKYEEAKAKLARLEDRCSGILDVLNARCDIDEEFLSENILKIMSTAAKFASKTISAFLQNTVR